MTNLSKMIDHTILKPEAKKKDIENLCKEAIEYKFAAVCVNPYYVSFCKNILRNSNVKLATVIGFPLGGNTKESKGFEALDAVNNGANEIDMVINIGALKNKSYESIKNEIQLVVDIAKDKALVKVIIETALLTKEEKIKACELAMESGADYVKTSTGFSLGGASVEDIKLMKSVVGDKLGIKASGGIRDLATAKKMIEAGATRLGTSSGIKIIENR